ncbi:MULTISPECIES: ATP-binding cassette domain-containing protein [unclassified Variovorax]|uniref:methionine ABC transporter ATP-binding protein n=1 Tax=Variovorax TaxID=34072 RepID=UPI001C5A4D5E|nr:MULTISPECIES: ATP-binding cassette domain-containing protein [unclassified Variovorax]MDM0088346.1 ATP-binding cassette domain-containing protein [Variovorax sp. J22G40]MDM0146419.1 ATP-binding cassette domain-containing protein [Variovorax sp. J2P1-31]
MTLSSTDAAQAPPLKPPVIRLQGVQKSFALPSGEVFDAVRALTLDIPEGEIFGLIGKSGAGKSTLLRLINLLERPDAGQVLVGGRDLTTLSRRELRDTRQNLGMIFQQFNLLQNASVFDNVAFPLKIHGRHSRAEIDARVRECLALVGLSEKIDTYPAQLSGGQKQRVAIARALAPRPQVLLCDEPTSALDSETTRSLLETLRDINAKIGVTIVIVTHELSVVEVLCRRVAILEKGQLIEQFAVDEAPQAERLTALGREIDALVRRRERDAREAANTPLSAAAAPRGLAHA